MELTLISPAKINLFLKVLGKRADGFHELSSLFQTVDLCDKLTFQTHHEDSLTCTDSSIPTDNTNLVSKAVILFRKKTGLNALFKIHIEKNIPSQAGLGGGSSNAATTLWALNEMTGKKVTTENLQIWSAEIGSDIPFFFSSGTAYCQGRGEKVTSISAMKSKKLWIVKPQMGLSTPLVYKTLEAPLWDGTEHSWLNDRENYFNDLEKPAFQLNPKLKELKEFLLQKGFSTVLMSGSGSSFFCLGEGEMNYSCFDNHNIFKTNYIRRTEDSWF